jgi:uncharacterized membrane protein (DUF4010 family)
LSRDPLDTLARTLTLDITQDITRLIVALGVGLIIGVERGWQRREDQPGSRAAGLRTFGLYGLIGGLAALFHRSGIAWVLPVAWLSVTSLALSGYLVETRHRPDVSLTTAVAAVTTFALGATAGLNHAVVAAGGAVVVALLLAFKERLHGWVAGLTAQELASGLQLLLITAVLLPLLPNRTIGPGALVNPRLIGWAVALLASLSFLAYVAVRLLGGNRGILVTALLGGLVSSTAVTATFARYAARQPNARSAALVGIVLASSMMFVRLMVLLAIIAPIVARGVGPALGLAAAAGLTLGLLLLWRLRTTDLPALELRNPLELSLALQFGVFVALVMALSRWLALTFGQAGLLAGAAAAGFADVDAISISLGRLAVEGIVGWWNAGTAIVLAVATNCLTKSCLTLFLGTRPLAARAAGSFSLMLAVALLMLWAMRLNT